MARTGRPSEAIVLTDDEQIELQRQVRAHGSSQAMALRANIILLASEGVPNSRIAERVGISANTVGKWRKRFAIDRIDGLGDAPRTGAPKRIPGEAIRTVVVETQFAKPPGGATHWTSRDMAAHAGMSQAGVVRIWRAVGLKPHLSDTFKLSTDPMFIDKVIDVVGLYLNPPENAVVLCADEKTQIQALQRTGTGEPVAPGHPATRSHDYKRKGTTTLFAAFDIVTGAVLHDHQDRHRAVEWLDFLRRIDTEVPAELDVHLVCDNYDTHKTPAVRDWLAEHERFHLHFTPTSSSWLNQVERWFSLVQNKVIARGEHDSIDDLKANLDTWIAHYNTDPKPFVWTKSADNIIEKFLKIQDRLIQRTYDSGH